ncbi:MAG TPA: radical SAM protein [bacterium]|nr:radical SAM protein [bacterium]
MKASKFNILTASKDEPGKYLLYNTLYDHRVLFDEPGLNPVILFDKIENRYPLTEREQEMIPDLLEMGLVLNDDADEQKLFEDWYQTRIRERTDIMQVTILPTMACNLACDYCFENEVREGGVMKPETVEKTIAYLKKKIDTVRPETLHVHFFGGEPLLQPETLKKIGKALHEHCTKLGIPLTLGMISNGFLLTPEWVNEMIPYGFQWVKITFDGDREAHDRKRIQHNRKGTFDKIYDNLAAVHEQCGGKLKFAIGGNFDQENYDSMFGLIERLKKSPFASKIMVARFKPIMAVNPDIASQREGRVSSFCEVCSFNQKQIDAMQALEDKLFEEEMPTQARPEMGPCEYHSRHSFTIGPDGSVYKCPAFVGLHNLAAGRVDEDDFNDQGERQIQSRKWDDDCESCHFLPNCAGGCRYSALNKTGSLDVKNCEGKFLEQSTEAFMQREIRTLSLEKTAASGSEDAA